MSTEHHNPSTPDIQDYGEVQANCIVALDYKDKHIGIAYYKFDYKLLLLSGDVEDVSPFQHCSNLLFQIEPDLLLITSRAHDILEATIGEVQARKEIRPVSEFNGTVAIERLASLLYNETEPNMVFGPGLSDREAKRKHADRQIRGKVDEEATIGLGCLNTLMIYLARSLDTDACDVEEQLQLAITDIQMFVPTQVMLLNSDTVYSLEIFRDEAHPNQYTNAHKESSSLFGLLNTCRTADGKTLMRQWFLKPCTDIAIVTERHCLIESLLLPRNIHLSDQLCRTIKKSTSMQRSIMNLQQGKYGNPARSEWHAILAFARNTIKIRQILFELEQEEPVHLISEIMQAFDVRKLEQMSNLINDVIDFDESEFEQRIAIKRLVDDELDEHKTTYDGLESILDSARSEIVAGVPREQADEVQCVYMPQLGFLVTVAGVEDETGEMGPIWSEEGLTQLFRTEDCIYYKNSKMVELDEYFGDIHSLIIDREIELLHQLQLKVLEHAELLINCSRLTTVLDCLLAFAEAAKKHDYVRPTMTEQSVLDIKQGRHPLRELTTQSFVPNDAYCRGAEAIDDSVDPSLILLTGANYSGKSILLKQTALIVYMAHLGSFVPAQLATIGITDRILTRVQTRETVAKEMSAFMLDLQQVSMALEVMTAKSLLIIDEFGKGTDATSGAGLFAALMEHLTDPQSIRPRTLVATHFHEVLHPDVMRMSSAIALKHMQILIDDQADDMAEQVTYLYCLADGPSTSSFGLNCAAMCGIPQPVLDRAAELLQITLSGENLVDALTELSEREKEDLREAERVARR